MISVVWNETWVQFYHFPAENSLQKDETDKLSNYVTKAEYGQICDEIDHLKETVERLRKELGA